MAETAGEGMGATNILKSKPSTVMYLYQLTYIVQHTQNSSQKTEGVGAGGKSQGARRPTTCPAKGGTWDARSDQNSILCFFGGTTATEEPSSLLSSPEPSPALPKGLSSSSSPSLSSLGAFEAALCVSIRIV